MTAKNAPIFADKNSYSTSVKREPLIPEAVFYPRFAKIIYDGGSLAKKGKYNAKEWERSSYRIFTALEKAGVNFEFTGMENIKLIDEPVVFISNHMSALETMVLPIIINPVKKVTFVVKQELIKYPYFGDLLAARNPIVVGRNNPREDLIKVINDGIEKLKDGISIILFPQKTRSSRFEPDQFNSLGIKLAKKAGVSVVPVALVTDAWQNGKYIKDIGKINIKKKVRINFGEPFKVESSGSDEHQRVLDHIESKLKEWGREDCLVNVI